MYLELGCLGNACITLQSTCYFHYQIAAAMFFIQFHILGGLDYVLRHFVNLFQRVGVVVYVGVLYIMKQKCLNYK